MTLKILTMLGGAAVGGAETFFVSLTTALARAKLDVRAVIRSNAEREAALTANGVTFDTAPFGSLWDFATAPTLRRMADGFKPDIVLAFAGRAASFMPNGAHLRVGRLGGYYNLRNFRRCDYLICNAPDLVRYVVEGGWREEQVRLIPNFPSVPDAPQLDRAQFQTPNDAPLAIALGRLHPNKGLDILISATALIPGLFVWIAGEGPERENLETLAHELGLNSRVKFLGWRNDRAALYKAADLCVYPSREEPFGNVVVEAWSCGTPLVATASTGPRWLVKDGHDAVLTPIDDVEALAKGIRAIIASQSLRASLSAAGLKRVSEEFSEPAIVARYIEFFESITSKGAR